MNRLDVADDRMYTLEHEWVVSTDADGVRLGISAYAVFALGDIVYLELPEVGDRLEAGEVFGEVESVKATSDLFAPVSGHVTAVNEQLHSTPEFVNTDPYGDGWLLELQPDLAHDALPLQSPAQYRAYIETL